MTVKRPLTAAALSLVLAACSAGESVSTTAAVTSTSTAEAPTSTSRADTASTSAPTTTEAPATTTTAALPEVLEVEIGYTSGAVEVLQHDEWVWGALLADGDNLGDSDCPRRSEPGRVGAPRRS